MIFFLMAIGFMMVGRRVGWAFSKAILYRSPVGPVVLMALSWGMAVALAMRYMIDWQEPSAILRWVMGYALGAYVAIPNYGLIAEQTIPDEARLKHNVISQVPMIAYVLASILMAVFAHR